MCFDEKNKSKAIITVLGKEKHHLIEEHKPNIHDQRGQPERNTQREIFRNESVWTKAKDDSNKQVEISLFFFLFRKLNKRSNTHTHTCAHIPPASSVFFL